MVYHGSVQGGIVVLDGGVQLADGTPVVVQTVETPARPANDDPVYRLGELATPTGVTDLASNIDHYLYGHPKAADEQS